MIVALVALIMDLKKRRVPMALEIVGAVLGASAWPSHGCLLGVCKTFPLWEQRAAAHPVPGVGRVHGHGGRAAGRACSGAPRVSTAWACSRSSTTASCIEMLLGAALLFITGDQLHRGPAASVQALVCGKYAWSSGCCSVAVGSGIPTVLETKMLFFSPKEFEESTQGPL